jgi:hypothetical protein
MLAAPTVSLYHYLRKLAMSNDRRMSSAKPISGPD